MVTIESTNLDTLADRLKAMKVEEDRVREL